MAEKQLPATEANQAGAEILALLSDIEARCRSQAVGLPQQRKRQQSWEGVMFYIGDEPFVCPLDQVREILNYPQAVTKVPGTKPWLLGVSNIRGTLIPVIDMLLFFTGQRTEHNRRNRVLVFRLLTGYCGVLVGEMVGIRHFPKTRAVAKKTTSPSYEPYVEYGFEQDGNTWSVFSLMALAEDPAFQTAAI